MCREFTYVANGEKIMKKSYLEGRENNRYWCGTLPPPIDQATISYIK